MQRSNLCFPLVKHLIWLVVFYFFTLLSAIDGVMFVHSAEIKIQSKLNDNQKNVLRECGTGFQKIERLHNNIEIQIKRDTVKIENDKESVIVDCDESLFLREGIYGRHDMRHRLPEDKGGVESEHISLLTPRQFYTFKRSGDTPYILGAKASVEDERGIIRSNVPFATYPYMANGYTFEEALLKDEDKRGRKHSPNYHIVEVNEIHENGDRVVRVKTLVTDNLGASSPVVYAFLRDRQWALKSLQEEIVILAKDASGRYDFSGPRSKKITEIEYEGESNDVPLVKRLTQTLYTPGGKPEQKTVYEVTKIVPGPPSLDIFDPKQFFSAKTEVTLDKAKFSWGRIFCIVTGLAMIAFALWKKFTRHRSQTSSGRKP